ncbi:MAG: nucleoid-associated protein [Oleiphilaceae bacterium]|nr:nucleoid-associated protein [Oleiphilaceae bacterium]
MAIRHLVFHRLTRWQDDQPAKILTGTETKDANADHQTLFSQYKKLFQFRAGKAFGRFSETELQSPFTPWLKEFNDGSLSFASLTTNALNHLCELANKTPEIFDRHVLFVDEEHADGDRFWIFLLEDSSGLMLDGNSELTTVDYLNTSKLELALKVDISAWLSDSDDTPYLSLIKGRGTSKLGEAFSQSAGFENSVDIAKETEALMEILSNYTKDTEKDEAAQVRQRAYDFCVEQQQMGEAVPLSELSGYLDENKPSKFAEFAEQSANIAPTQELRPDTRKLKHLVRLSGKGNGLSLSFSSDLFQQTILYDESSDTLTITAIPKSLKKQLSEFIKDKED